MRGMRGERMKFAVIPAYEPGDGLTEIVSALKRQEFEVVVTDDGSGDAYAEIFRKAGDYAHVISYPVNRGKGHALKAAFAWLRGRVGDGDAVVTLDCDGQHRLEDAVKLCEAARRRHAEDIPSLHGLDGLRHANRIAGFLRATAPGSVGNSRRTL